MAPLTWRRHAWSNRLQTSLLLFALLGISGLAGALLFGDQGMWIALLASLLALLIEPATGRLLVLIRY